MRPVSEHILVAFDCYAMGSDMGTSDYFAGDCRREISLTLYRLKI